MRKITTVIALILCLSFCVAAFAACGKDKKPAKTDPPVSTTAAVTTDRWDVDGPAIAAALSEAEKTFKIEVAEFNEVEKASKNKMYLVGPDDEELEEGDVSTIEQMVYDRNKAAKQLLGTTIEYEYWNYSQSGWNKAQKQINTVVSSETEGAPDLFVNQIYDLNKVMLTLGAFQDVWSIPGSYFDFKAAGWMDDWMQSLSFTGDRAYVLAGDYFVDVLRSMGVMPFNATLMDETASKLAPALFEGGLSDGETMSQRFFDYVEAGNWTWDALGKLCEAVFDDKNGDDQADMGDVLGTIADCYGGVNTAVFIYSCGEELIDRRPNAEKGGKMWAYYPSDPSSIGDIFDKVASVFNGTGALATTGVVADTENGLASHRIKFAKNEILFLGYALLGDLEDDTFQQMQSLYSVVPLPKVSTDKQYNTFVTDTADAGAINVHSTKARAISAYLQYCTEHSAEIREEFLEIVTKYKTTVYNQGTDRMLDLIYDSILYGGAKVIDGAVKDDGGYRRWYDFMKDGECVVTSAEFISEFNSCVEAKQTTLDEVLDKWYKLPKVEATEE